MRRTRASPTPGIGGHHHGDMLIPPCHLMRDILQRLAKDGIQSGGRPAQV